MTKARFLALLALLVAIAMSAGAGAGSASEQATIDPQLSAVLATATDVAALREVGITQGFTFGALPAAGVVATADQVAALAAQPEVRSLYLNRELTYDNYEATLLTGVDAVRADAWMTKKNDGVPVDGSGVGILVNDTGVDGTHQDHDYPTHLVQNVEAVANPRAWSDLLPVVYVEDVENTDSTGGHGTHVAGIAAGTGAMSDGKYEGVAPGADLVGYGSGATLFLLDVLGGFDYALANQQRYGIRVVTNSWGDTGDKCTPVNPDDPITFATYLAFKRDISVVFSAGNSGRQGECTITGNYKKAPWVIAVAAGDKQRNLANFSSRGTPGGGGSFELEGKTWTWEDRPTVTAPGVSIVSTRVISPIGVINTDEDLTTIEPEYLAYYTTLSGTSMAAPHVAGIVAMMLDANATLTPLEVKEIVEKTATSIPYETWEAGTGYVDAFGAVERAFKSPSN